MQVSAEDFVSVQPLGCIIRLNRFRLDDHRRVTALDAAAGRGDRTGDVAAREGTNAHGYYN